MCLWFLEIYTDRQNMTDLNLHGQTLYSSSNPWSVIEPSEEKLIVRKFDEDVCEMFGVSLPQNLPTSEP